MNLASLEKININRNNHLMNNENEKKNINIQFDMPNPYYRTDPDYSNKHYKRIVNPLYPPEKSYDAGNIVSTPMLNRVPGLPINIKTRGYGGDYQQIGIIYNDSQRLPLYGRQTYRGSNQWNYYTATDSNQSIKIPINKSGNKCTDERGCPEINQTDSVDVSTFNEPFKAEIYSNEGPRYIPY